MHIATPKETHWTLLCRVSWESVNGPKISDRPFAAGQLGFVYIPVQYLSPHTIAGKQQRNSNSRRPS